MSKDFIPPSHPKLYTWLTAYNGALASRGPALGVSSGVITATQARIASYQAGADAVLPAKDAYKSVVANRNDLRKSLVPFLRKQIRAMKANGAYTAADGKLFGMLTSAPAFDHATFKTKLRVRLDGGIIRIAWTKRRVDSVNIYGRLAGQSAWTLLGRDSESPYLDQRPLANPAVPEKREYMARGVVNDVEIGVDSDIVTVVFAG
jgi:hypothetical protein